MLRNKSECFGFYGVLRRRSFRARTDPLKLSSRRVGQVFGVCVTQDVSGLPELFSPGMLVRCVVSSLSITERGKKTIKLSLNPKKVNEVLSAEALKPGMVCVHSWEVGTEKSGHLLKTKELA